MKLATRLLIALTSFTVLTATAEADVWESIKGYLTKPHTPVQPSFRVLILEDAPDISIEVTGPFRVYDPRTGDSVLRRKMGKSDKMEAERDGILWGEEFPGIFQLHIIPDSPSITTIVNGKTYKGSLYIYQVDDKLNIVNSVNMEDFLSSVITPMFSGAIVPQELLAAIAITARTNAYFLAENPKNSYWAIQADKVNYDGYSPGPYADEIAKAIHETHHMVLSKTGTYEGIITTFPLEWRDDSEHNLKTPAKSILSKITLQDAERLATKGKSASDILAEAFPKSSIQLIYHSPGTE